MIIMRDDATGTRNGLRLPSEFRRRVTAKKPFSVVKFLNYRMRITDGQDFFIQCKDIFGHGIYHFDSERRRPRIIDGGSNIGTSILYFKHVYPRARIIGFEPDPNIYLLLRENMERNGHADVILHNAGLGADDGVIGFSPDDGAGGHFDPATGRIKVKVRRLSGFLDEPVDFVKLNIEGQELPVLQELANSGAMVQISELVLEYHGVATGEHRLGAILDLLAGAGFRYLVHDFDAETNPRTKPPFHLTDDTRWFCLVYAKRL
jgi:FkbM family methyltransferase